MENTGLADMWCEKLQAQGWSGRAVERFTYSWAPGTLLSYDRNIRKLAQFCDEHGVVFPPNRPAELAEFLCDVADRSNRPASILHTASAAIGHLYKANELGNLMENDAVKRLIIALIKCGTTAPMNRSRAMPVQAFHDLFLGWPDNSALDLKRLRLKTITLLALTLMLRPSDVAPNSVLFDSVTGKSAKCVFTLDQLDFQDNGVEVTLFGIKNDMQRKGFQVMLPKASEFKLDPVQTLQDYTQQWPCVSYFKASIQGS
jgi:hypothetical protein